MNLNGINQIQTNFVQVSKGKEEGEALMAKAKADAAELIQQARQEAADIVEQAHKEARDYKTKVEGDVKMAATQALQATRTEITQLVVTQAVAPVADALSSEEYLKGIITAVAQRFSAQESADLSLILPEKLQAGLEPFVKGELAKTLGKGVEVRFSKKLSGGFKIGPRDGSYFIDLSDEGFQALLGEYMRPATKKILFG